MRQFRPHKRLVQFRLKQKTSRKLQTLLAWGLALLAVYLLAHRAWEEIQEVDYRIQEDGRQHIFWMLRYIEPDAFPNDPMADYFQAMAPWLYRAIYAGGWHILGITPHHLTFGLPLVLGLIAVGYAIAIGRHLSSIPWVGGLAGILCAQTLWMEDDLVSATPRAFATPLMMAFLFYVLRRNPWGCGLTIAMQAGLYPPAALISWGTTCLRLGDRRNRVMCIVATVALGLGLLPLVLSSDPFGSIITVQEARSVLEFQVIGDVYGRAFFFHDNPILFWGFGPRSGFFFWGLMAPLNLAALGWSWARRHRMQTAGDVPEHSHLHLDSKLLWQFVLSASLFYGIAHLALFNLHFPARYTYHGFRTILPIAGAIVLVEIGRWQIHRWQTHSSWGHRAANLALVSFQLALIGLPFSTGLTIDNQLYATGRAVDLYALLQNTPHDTLIATLDKEGNNLPIFAGRSTLVGGEYTLPYHPAYYSVLRQRATDLLAAHVTPDPTLLKHVLDRYPITYFLTHKDGFTPKYLRERTWLHSFQPEFDQAMQQLEAQQQSGGQPALQQLQSRCIVLETRGLFLIEADCLRNQLAAAAVQGE